MHTALALTALNHVFMALEGASLCSPKHAGTVVVFVIVRPILTFCSRIKMASCRPLNTAG